MNKKETAQIMAILQVNYPDSFKDQTDDMLMARINLWAEMFKDFTYPEVSAAVKAHIATDTGRFMPPVGVIMTKLNELIRKDQLSEMEAWAKVRKAISGASLEAWSRRMNADGTMGKTSAERQFESLPPIIQLVIATPEQLAEWEKLDDDEINTVIQSNFMRSYRARAKEAREREALPREIKRILDEHRVLATEGVRRLLND